MTRREMPVLALATATLLAITPAAAAADGLPVPVEGDAIGNGVPSAEGDFRYAAIPARGHTTLLRLSMEGAAIKSTRKIDGRYGVPAVALDGTPSGLSHDGDTLVVIKPRRSFPRAETSLAVVDPRTLRVTDEILLRGDFSFDALSPDGETMYLIEYTSRRDPGAYQVRALDIASGRLESEPILDADEAPGQMRGLPVTRATSPDGRWEYTLYDGGGGEPFIHALDVVDAETVCIDLPAISEREVFRVDLSVSPDGGTITASRGAETLALADTDTFDVSEPLTPDAGQAVEEEGGGISGMAIGLIAAGVALVVGTALGLRRRRRGEALPDDPFAPGEPESQRAPDADRERVDA